MAARTVVQRISGVLQAQIRYSILGAAGTPRIFHRGFASPHDHGEIKDVEAPAVTPNEVTDVSGDIEVPKKEKRKKKDKHGASEGSVAEGEGVVDQSITDYWTRVNEESALRHQQEREEQDKKKKDKKSKKEKHLTKEKEEEDDSLSREALKEEKRRLKEKKEDSYYSEKASSSSSNEKRSGAKRPLGDIKLSPHEEKAAELLQNIVSAELNGVIRYTLYSLAVQGPHRVQMQTFFKAQAAESLLHAQEAGELLTGIGSNPSVSVAPVEEDIKNSTMQDLLVGSYDHEGRAIDLYKDLLKEIEGKNVFLEEYARKFVSQEEQHRLELRKMLRDFKS